MLGIVVTKEVSLIDLDVVVSSLCEDIDDFSVDGFDNFLPLLSCFTNRLFLNSFLHLLTILCLFADSNFVAMFNQGLNIVLKTAFMESYVRMLLSWGNDYIN